MEKQPGEREKFLIKEDLRRPHDAINSLRLEMKHELEKLEAKIVEKDKQVTNALHKVELIMIAKDAQAEKASLEIKELNDLRIKDLQESRAEQSQIFLKRIEDADMNHKAQMLQQLEFRKEMREEGSRTLQMLERLHRDTMAYQTKQLETLTKGMESFALCKPSAEATERPSRKITNARVVIIDTFGADDALKEPVSNDENAIQMWFGDQADVRPVQDNKSTIRSINQYKSEDYSMNDGILVFLFSYGSNMTLREETKTFNLESILLPFIKNPTLLDKPKMFLMQVIQRGKEENVSTYSPSKDDDYLLCYCEMPENRYRLNSSEKGSLFVKSLIKALQRFPKNNFSTLLEKTRDDIFAKNNESDMTFVVENHLKEPVCLVVQ